ncbi:hypothetical protein Nepgr_019932 [Nepenthes gracilis]|uniref:C2 NT-type domain-containing protein n=1 Tax=Nepenthes gracilis TaxID=150966 RepID=A0AAD3XVV0_NEPGR|nr:hypothetical protein Nepgr_019932 [Nepenthes gracilis]
MMPKASAGKRSGDDSNDGKLLREIEAISKGLYLDRNASKNSVSTSTSRSKSINKVHVLEPNLKSRHGSDEPPNKDKKSFWNWKPLKALSHVRNRRFNCCFTLQVHKIESLPPDFDDLSLCVHWKRRDGEGVTNPVQVIEGVAEFEEGLNHTCSVYGSRSGPHHSAKYEAKHFLLYAAVHGNPQLDLGKHRVDLTRLLPLTLEELEEEKSSGKWTTTFKLLGKAKGAIMNVSFGYLVLRDNPGPAPNNKNVLELLSSKQNNETNARTLMKVSRADGKGMLPCASSLPFQGQKSLVTSQSTKDIKVLHEVLPVTKSELSDYLKVLDEKLDQESLDPSVANKAEPAVSNDQIEPVKPSLSVHFQSDSSKENLENDSKDSKYFVSQLGVPLHPEEKVQLDEDSANVVDGPAVESHDVAVDHTEVGEAAEEESNARAACGESNNVRDMVVIHDCNLEANAIYTKESLFEELESALNYAANLENSGFDSPEATSELADQENYSEANSNRMGRPLNLDDLAESVASEFLSMLGLEDSPFGLSSEGEPESPRERLLREFEKETMATGGSLFDFETGAGDESEYGYDAPFVSGWVGAEFDPSIGWADEIHQFESQGGMLRPRAKVLEDLETEALMREWGLNEEAFQSSPPNSTAGFGSPVYIPAEEPLQLPPLGDSLGPFIQTKNGGFLRSMNPALFRNAKSGGSLIMQVSSPVVVPAAMGSGFMEILQHLGSLGLEKLSMQANKLMPLEDITGTTMQQIAWQAAPELEGSMRQDLLHHESETDQLTSARLNGVKGKCSKHRPNKLSPRSATDNTDSEYVSLEDLAPLAMDKIEALSLEGLRIQSGMSQEESPSNISAHSVGEFSALKGGKRSNHAGSMGLEGAVGLQLLDLKGGSADVDGLMGLSITLDEWMRLDSGEIDEEEQMSERTSKILAAHHASYTDLTFVGKKGEKKKGRNSGKWCGLLGNNFTVALMVQLRDPLRDYEPVGMPMLALIQVERVFVPPKPKIYSTVAQVRTIDEEDDEPELIAKVEIKEQKIEEVVVVPQYKITEVHVAGLKTESGKKKLWGK